MVYLGIYAYKNPDPTQCWVVRDLASSWTSRADALARADTMGIDVTEGFPMEMHAVFVTWFLWGFWAKVALVISMAFGFGVYKANPYLGKIIMFLTGGLYAANGIMWLGVGGIWRYSKGGMVAAGAELAKSPGTSEEVWIQQI